MTKKETAVQKFVALLSAIFPEDVKINLIDIPLEDGVVIRVESIEVGKEVMIVDVATDTVTPAPDGDLQYEGNTITISGGVITEIKPIEAEVEVEEAMSEELKEAETKLSEIKMGYEAQITQLTSDIETLKASYEAKLSEQKTEYETKLNEVVKASGKNEVIQAPKPEQPKAPLTTKEIIMREIEQKRKNK